MGEVLKDIRQPEVANQFAVLRTIIDDDQEFLFQLYTSTRHGEKALAGWGDEQWAGFMRMQFNLQHLHYMRNYDNPTFNIIILGNIPVGRLYVNQLPDEIRIIDISLLPDYHGRGIGTGLLRRILRDGDERGIAVTLHVEKNNPALALYRRLGFLEVRSEEVYCFMKRPPGGVLKTSNDERSKT